MVAKHEEMAREPVGRLLLRYSLPAVAAMVLNTAYNVVDRIVVGQATGIDGLAALTVAIPFLMFGAAGAGMANAGGLSLVGRRLGAGDRPGAERAVAQAALSGIISNSLLALLLWPLVDPILAAFGAGDATREPARAFALAMLAGYPVQGACQGLAAGIRSQGRAGTSLAIGASMLVVNTALCAGFVFGLGWGTAGSAWAVLGANLVGLLLYWAYYRFGGGALRVDWRLLRPCGVDQFEIVRTGIGAWLANTMPALLILVVNSLMARHAGDTGLALVGIVHVVGLMAIMPVLGVMQAAGPLFSYNHGAGRPERVRRAFRQSLAAASLVLCAFWVPIEVFPAQTAGLFAAGNAALEKLAGATFGVFFLAYPLIGITYAVSQYFQSIGRGGASAINALSRQVVFLVPAMLIMERLGGFAGFVWSTPVADGLGVLLALAFWWREHLRSKSTPARVTAGG